MKKVIAGLSFLVPFLASAQTIFGGVAGVLGTIRNIFTLLLPIIFALALIYFFWGVAKYVLAAGDPKAAAEGKSIMIYGVIALAVMASVYGLINILQSTILGSTGAGTVTLPPLP
jgi:hypothetical protein